MGVKITKLLAEFQAGNPVAKFDKEGQAGGSRKYGYASYNSVIECLKQLAAKGLSWSHKVGGEYHGTDAHSLVVTTTINYEDELLSSTMVRPMMPDIQKLGSEITYLKRYQLVALCGMAADEDDDGAAAMPDTTAKAGRAPRQPAPAQQAGTSPTFDAALTALGKSDSARKRQEFLANVATRTKQGKLTAAEYTKLAEKTIGMIQDADELSTNIAALIEVALEDKVISPTVSTQLQSMLSLRVKQLASAAAIGGTMKAGV